MDVNSQTIPEIDPVCGMEVDRATAVFKSEHKGHTYYFCSRGCMLDFQDDLERYLDPSYQPTGMESHSH
jgi:P-type Cu+ transporter